MIFTKFHKSHDNAPNKHVRPTHLSDDKYLILLFLCFSVEAILACAQIKVSRTTTNEASAYLFSFNTNSRTLDHWLRVCVYVCEWQSRAERRTKMKQKGIFQLLEKKKTSSLCNASCFFMLKARVSVLHPFSIVWWFL